MEYKEFSGLPESKVGNSRSLQERRLIELLANGPFMLIAGAVLMILSDMRGSEGLFAWIMPVPYLLYAIRHRSAKKMMQLFFSLWAGSVLMLAKAISTPLGFSLPFALMSGTVTALRYFIVFLLWRWIRRRIESPRSLAVFPLLAVSFEFLQAYLTPFGDWGSLANTQLYNLPLLQIASLGGFLAISVLVAWGSALTAELILLGAGRRALFERRYAVAAFTLVLTAAYIYGDLRLDQVPKGPQILAAAVMSDYRFAGEIPEPDSPAVRKNSDALVEKTRAAARVGARLVAWGEGSTVVSPNGEKALLARLSRIAEKRRIQIVAAYVVIPKGGIGPGRPFQNKYSWILEDGSVAQTYYKHHPVPGEGSVKGDAPLKLVGGDLGGLTGAICYDYDFPGMALSHAAIGADMVVVAGLDWRGMLCRHALMARIRAIEGGFSLLRPANGATSMAFDNRGRIRAAMSNFGENDKIMLASLPASRNFTLYSRIGNLPAYFALAVLLRFLVVAYMFKPGGPDSAGGDEGRPIGIPAADPVCDSAENQGRIMRIRL